jgi:hypothetical protein
MKIPSLSVALLFLSLAAIPAHADTFFNITGSATLNSQASCNCPETFSFSIDLDEGFGFTFTGVPGTALVTSSSGPFGTLVEADALAVDGTLNFAPVGISSNVVDIDVWTGIGVPPLITGTYTVGVGLYNCLEQPLCSSDFSTEIEIEDDNQGTATITVSQISNPAPEPASLLLVLTGIFLVFASRKSQRLFTRV